VARMTGLVSRHRELMADSAGVQPRVPVSRAAGSDPPVRLVPERPDHLTWQPTAMALCGRWC